MRSIKPWASIALVWLLSACGGGGTSGSTPTPPAPVTVSGTVVPGPVSGANVQLLSVDAQGRTTMLEQVSTGADGNYAFRASPAANAVLMVAASGGTWTDPIRKAGATLDTTLRSIDVWTGSPQRINVTAYTEVTVRSIEKAASPNWLAASIRAANQAQAQALGVDSLTDFSVLDLTLPAGSTAPKTSDVTHAVINGSFLGLWHRLETAPGQLSLTSALQALYTLTQVDPDDDRLGPALIGGTVDFIDVMALSADDKLRTKGRLLYGTDILPTATTIAQALPRGVSSGGGVAPMPDDQFKLVDQPAGRTHFNQRGALVAYGEGDAKTRRRELYSASVADVYADGDIGIGRWNGGVQQLTDPSGTGTVTNANILGLDGLPYAAAREVTQMPSCGSRKLAWAANTKVLFNPLNSGGTGASLTVATDSALRALYLGQVSIGVDIGLITSTGETLRLRSTGGLDHPELAGLQNAAENDIYLDVPVSAMFPSGSTARLTVRAAGAGARKAAALLRVHTASGDIYTTALAFVAPDAPPDASGCAQPGNPGPGIDPRPAAGSQFVFLKQGDTSLYMGIPQNAVAFGSAGELQGSIGSLKFSAPVADLAGNSFASIGRVTVTMGDAALGNLVVRSQPYAVALPGTNTPATGSAVYELVAATAVTAERGSGAAQLSPGQIDSARVVAYFGQDPVGTPNPNYGTARFTVTGRFAGMSFGTEVNASRGFGPLDARIYGQAMSTNSVTGAFAGPTGEYLVAFYEDGVVGVPIRAALLFRRQAP